MKLSPNASFDDVKAQFRKLRGEYFASDAEKYRQLQTAYAVLVDPESRREYDELYRASMGLPLSPGETAESSRSAGGAASPKRRKSALVKSAVSRINAQSHVVSGAGDWQRMEEESRRKEEEEERRQRDADSNWGLKHFEPLFTPLIGSRPYHSFVPVAVVYGHVGVEVRTEVRTRSRRPRYVGKLAAKAMP